MAREKKVSKLASINLSAKYTKKDLMEYIRTVTDYINTTIRNRSINKSEPVLKSARLIGKRYGIKRVAKGKGRLDINGTKGLLKYNIWGKSHDELLAHARLLKSHLSIDEETTLGQQIMSEKLKSQYESFIENDLFGDVSEKEYVALVNVFGQLGSDLVEKYSSTELRSLFIDLRRKDRGMSRNFVDIARDVYHDNQGLSQEKLVEKLREAIEDML